VAITEMVAIAMAAMVTTIITLKSLEADHSLS
jgi:hypothetical protein